MANARKSKTIEAARLAELVRLRRQSYPWVARQLRTQGIEVSDRSIAHYANGDRSIPNRLIEPICRVLGSHPNYLHGRANDPDDPDSSPSFTGGVNEFGTAMVETDHDDAMKSGENEMASVMENDVALIIELLHKYPSELAMKVLGIAANRINRPATETRTRKGNPPRPA